MKWKANIAHAIVNHYSGRVLQANPVTTARAFQAYRNSGGKTGLLGVMGGARMRSLYVHWIATRASNPGIAKGIAPEHRMTAPVAKAVTNIFNEDLHSGRSRY